MKRPFTRRSHQKFWKQWILRLYPLQVSCVAVPATPAQRQIEKADQGWPSESEDNLVSWQSAFFAIVAVAISVLLQNTGAVLGKDRSLLKRICLRSSPIICLLDTGFCVTKFISMCALGASPGAAAKYAWHDRFENPESRVGSGIDTWWRFSMIAFVMGQLLQSVKIFTCQNIQFTQFLTAVYLVAFVVPEVFRAFAGEAPEFALANTLPVGQAKFLFAMIQRMELIVGVVLQVGGWIWVFAAVLPSSWFIEGIYFSQASKSLTFMAHTTMLVSSCFFLLFNLLFSTAITCISSSILARFRTSFDRRVMERPSSVGLFITIVEESRSENARQYGILVAIMLINYSVVGIFIVWGTVPFLRFFTAFGLLPFLIMPVYVLYRVIFSGRIIRYSRMITGLEGSPRDFSCIMFLLANFTSCMVYYSCLYDPVGTYKPGWTDKLG